MMSKKIKSIVATVMASAILCASVPEMGVDAAKMTRTMNWAGYGVTITNSWSDLGYANCNTLKLWSGANSSGTLLVSKACIPTPSVAVQAITNQSKTKSAEAWHMVKNGSKTVQLKIYYRNKGVNYKY